MTAARIIALYRKGLSLEAVAHRVGMSKAAVYRVLKSHGEPRRHTGYPNGRPRGDRFSHGRAIRLRAKGLSLRQIARELGVSHTAVSLAIHPKAAA